MALNTTGKPLGKVFSGLLICTLFLSSVALLGIWYAFYNAEMFGGYNFYFTPDWGMRFELLIFPALISLNAFFLILLAFKPKMLRTLTIKAQLEDC